MPLRRGQGYIPRVSAIPAVHRQFLDRCRPLDKAAAILAQRKARHEYANHVSNHGNQPRSSRGSEGPSMLCSCRRSQNAGQTKEPRQNSGSGGPISDYNYDSSQGAFSHLTGRCASWADNVVKPLVDGFSAKEK
ncbi:hypothetical protein GCM10010365_51740 [Streptomyces poonensis]|uniref:Uncharacterized protein n=1 Tax=Streptomyces poonensis TaxID=68255 RepID=A0A918UPG7_9ACTN|nr:hypothetical protein GCM10010365_51740 [Streptomyces poonensis]GLJ93590.1 hypothetical protein GCM10017589_62050 [Streptomyces poonensis]